MDDKMKEPKYLSNDNKPIKSCFCIGPEKCNDKTCRIVKDYLERKKSPFGNIG